MTNKQKEKKRKSKKKRISISFRFLLRTAPDYQSRRRRHRRRRVSFPDGTLSNKRRQIFEEEERGEKKTGRKRPRGHQRAALKFEVGERGMTLSPTLSLIVSSRFQLAIR